jgi:major membrane immunogen (membrane-anchored lipoprotein)
MLDAKIPPAKVSIDKRDLDTGDEVPGATLRLTGVDKDNKAITFTKGVLETASSDQVVKDSGEYLEWKSGDKPSTVTLTDGTYTLEEVTPPDGYQTATNIKFTVENGKVVSIDEIVSDSNDVTMRDEKIPPAKVSIDKRDLDTGDEVPGATLRLTGVDKDNKAITFTKGVLETASSDQIVKDSGDYLEWKSGDKPSTVTLTDGTYTLEEITPPDGYQTATNIKFTVENGKVVSIDEIVSDSNDVTMRDEKIPPAKVSIDKRDLDTGDEVPGATLRLTGVDKDNKAITFTKGVLETASADQVVKDSGEYLEWKSGDSPSTVTLTDGTYTLEEVTPPDGYQTATNITFTVKDGKVVTVNDVTTDSNDITMLDAKIPPAKVSIDKRDLDTGDEVPGATLRLTGVDSDNKAIEFTKGVLETASSDQIVKDSGEYLEWKSGDKPSTVTLTDGT